MKIYTKTGDQGETGLLGGVRVAKSHLAVATCGSLDETNSLIGLARSHGLLPSVDVQLTQIQHDLFDLGSRVADCMAKSQRPPEFPASRAGELESWIDAADEVLPPLAAFILPSGGTSGSTLHLARSVCRRAERELVSLIESGVDRPLADELIYLNRLGDYLFVVARLVNQQAAVPETTWQVGRGL